ncbi:hypothetical protein JCM19274_199 [Algibacter lectus]|uniref:Uncharacterized protein n=1 Tax=Algibacter lectus TaxID=221126 RepID=A0A090WZZ8_9FLAO|nr:hypothetical protein JCM19274_199 [Algibacter lectus]
MHSHFSIFNLELGCFIAHEKKHIDKIKMLIKKYVFSLEIYLLSFIDDN